MVIQAAPPKNIAGTATQALGATAITSVAAECSVAPRITIWSRP